MSSLCKIAAVALALATAIGTCVAEVPLRVCSDPGNLPFSNVRGEGFENQLALWVGHDLGRKIDFVWWPQRVRFIEKRLKAGQCDLVMVVPSGWDLMMTSDPYYRSSYVFVSRTDRHLQLHSLHDAPLHKLKIGLHVIGDEMEAVPPARELTANGMAKNIVGYSIYGRPLEQNPEAELITAVAHGDIDVAVAWGPTAGYFASQSPIPLQLAPICQATRRTFWPLYFDISVGVRRGDEALLRQVNRVIADRKSDISGLLRKYHVPVSGLSEEPQVCE